MKNQLRNQKQEEVQCNKLFEQAEMVTTYVKVKVDMMKHKGRASSIMTKHI